MFQGGSEAWGTRLCSIRFGSPAGGDSDSIRFEYDGMTRSARGALRQFFFNLRVARSACAAPTRGLRPRAPAGAGRRAAG